MDKNWVKNMLTSTLKTDTLSEPALLHHKITHLFMFLNISYSQIIVLVINDKTDICV